MSRFPVIDPNVQWIMVTDLRAITLPDFKALKKVLVVHDESTPLVVVLPFQMYQEMTRLAELYLDEPPEK